MTRQASIFAVHIRKTGERDRHGALVMCPPIQDVATRALRRHLAFLPVHEPSL